MNDHRFLRPSAAVLYVCTALVGIPGWVAFFRGEWLAAALLPPAFVLAELADANRQAAASTAAA